MQRFQLAGDFKISLEVLEMQKQVGEWQLLEIRQRHLLYTYNWQPSRLSSSSTEREKKKREKRRQ